MNKLVTLWDSKESWLWDSTVITDWKKVFKLYPQEHFPESDLVFYKSIQSRLNWIQMILKTPISFWFRKKVHTFEIDFLPLDWDITFASDIIDWELLIVDEVRYIDWVTLWDIEKRFFAEGINIITKLLKQHLESKTGLFFWTDILNPILANQINPYNIKVIEVNYKTWVAKLVVTDIAMKVFKFILWNKKIINLGLNLV